jgi:hypothetical protein
MEDSRIPTQGLPAAFQLPGKNLCFVVPHDAGGKAFPDRARDVVELI